VNRQKSGARLQDKLRDYPETARMLASVKAAFGPGVKLKWIRFSDGTEIGNKQ